MAAAANLVLKDRLAVNVTYAPIVIKTGEKAQYVDRTNSAIVQQGRATYGLIESSTKRIVTGKLSFPCVQADGSIETGFGEFKYTLPVVLTREQRQEVDCRTVAMITDAVCKAMVADGETAW